MRRHHSNTRVKIIGFKEALFTIGISKDVSVHGSIITVFVIDSMGKIASDNSWLSVVEKYERSSFTTDVDAGTDAGYRVVCDTEV